MAGKQGMKIKSCPGCQRWSSIARPESVSEQKEPRAKLGEVPELQTEEKHETPTRDREEIEEMKKGKAINLIAMGGFNCHGHPLKGHAWAFRAMVAKSYGTDPRWVEGDGT